VTDDEAALPSDLQGIREAIEALDRTLLALLQRRRLLGERAARAKIAAAVPLKDPVREEVVLQRAREAAVELGLDAHQTERLYRVILDMSLHQQQAHLLELETVPLRVAFQGGEGSAAERAAQARYAGRSGGALLTGHPTLAEAVEAVRSGRSDVAFVALESTAEGSTRAFDLLTDAGLVISGEAYQRVDSSEDYVRYVEVGRELATAPPGVPCKTSVMLHLEHRAGALGELLQTFSRHGVNLTRLESRPVPGAPLRSRFFIDMEGHAADQEISRALDEARVHAEVVKVVGSYPAATLSP
jgi:prephenate dehydratase/chorismate mutase